MFKDISLDHPGVLLDLAIKVLDSEVANSSAKRPRLVDKASVRNLIEALGSSIKLV